MNKKQLIEAISEKTNLSKSNVESVLSTLIEQVLETSKTDKVVISGLGIFSSAERKARNGINPLTKEPIKIAARTVPKFKAAKAFKDAVN